MRDLDGSLVVSHDPPSSETRLGLDQVLEAHRALGAPGTLAVNVKADGLSGMLREALSATNHWFAFDMSVPDMRLYHSAGLPYYTRHSEFETSPPFYEQATGVWLDCFESDWFTESDVATHLDSGKAVCLVSPELHGRAAQPIWQGWADWRVLRHPSLQVCTDEPMLARQVLA